jgi:hypothetical protein
MQKAQQILSFLKVPFVRQISNRMVVDLIRFSAGLYFS